MNKFTVTYGIVTPESAEHGDYAENGVIAEKLSLRDAVSELGYSPDTVETDSWPVSRVRWLTFYRVNEGTSDYYETGAEESRSLHIPDTVTDASSRRIARLLGAKV